MSDGTLKTARRERIDFESKCWSHCFIARGTLAELGAGWRKGYSAETSKQSAVRLQEPRSLLSLDVFEVLIPAQPLVMYNGAALPLYGLYSRLYKTCDFVLNLLI